MKAYDKDKPLISIHVPKCGGTSVLAMLGKWFGTRLYPHYFDEELNRMPQRREFKGGICIHGHFNRRRRTGVRDYYPEADQFITMLRDPFEMVVARYFYAKGQW